MAEERKFNYLENMFSRKYKIKDEHYLYLFMFSPQKARLFKK